MIPGDVPVGTASEAVPSAAVHIDGSLLVRVNLALSLSAFISVIGMIVSGVLGWANAQHRLGNVEAAVYGSAIANEPGLRADMKSVDERLNQCRGDNFALATRVAVLENQFKWETATRAAKGR